MTKSLPSRAGWVQMGSPIALHLLATSGFDWVGVDAQHGAYSRGSLLDSMRGWQPSWADIMVRVPTNDLSEIGFALDLGATGVIVPLVNNAGEARGAVDASLYPPQGHRSWGPLSPRWGTAPLSVDAANERVRCWVMIETADAIENLDAIMAVEGLHGVFVGPTDLSISLDMSYDELFSEDGGADVIRRIVSAAEAAGVHVAAYGGGASDRLRELGIHDLVVASDLDFIVEGAAAAVGRASAASGY